MKVIYANGVFVSEESGLQVTPKKGDVLVSNGVYNDIGARSVLHTLGLRLEGAHITAWEVLRVPLSNNRR